MVVKTTVTFIHPDSSTVTQISKRHTDALGRVVKVVEDRLGPDEAKTLYTYDAFDNLIEVTEEGAIYPVEMKYDIRGSKTGMNDPDMGMDPVAGAYAWKYEYNGFGELVKQTDAKAQDTLMEYDRLGRMTKRTWPARRFSDH